MEMIDGLVHPNCGAYRIASTTPPIISTSNTREVYFQYDLRIIPKPAAMSRKGQMCVSAHRFAEGMVPALTSSQITPAAINNKGPNSDLFCCMISFFLISTSLYE